MLDELRSSRGPAPYLRHLPQVQRHLLGGQVDRAQVLLRAPRPHRPSPVLGISDAPAGRPAAGQKVVERLLGIRVSRRPQLAQTQDRGVEARPARRAVGGAGDGGDGVVARGKLAERGGVGDADISRSRQQRCVLYVQSTLMEKPTSQLVSSTQHALIPLRANSRPWLLTTVWIPSNSSAVVSMSRFKIFSAVLLLYYILLS